MLTDNILHRVFIQPYSFGFIAKKTRNNTLDLFILYIYTFCKVNIFLMLSFVKNCCHGDHHSIKVFQSGSNRRENLKFLNFVLIVRGEFKRYQFQGRKYNLKRHLEKQICKNTRFIPNRAKSTAKFWIWSSEKTGLPKNNKKLWIVFGSKCY